MDDFEEWNRETTTFATHCIAGSLSGLMEHVTMYPVDTVKTHMQAHCYKYNSHSTRQVVSELVAKEGVFRLWRGVTTMFSACIPAHAAYFSLLEYSKDQLEISFPGHSSVTAGISGMVATTAHDFIMAPLDLLKQRIQLGNYEGMFHGLRTIVATEGAGAMFVSLPTTLLMNLPYAAIMVSINEGIKDTLNPDGGQNMGVFLLAGACGGAAAAAVTCPLDVVKTQLQTSSVLDCVEDPGSSKGCSRKPVKLPSGKVPAAPLSTAASAYCSSGKVPVQLTPIQICKRIIAEEGPKGFFRGVKQRVMLHTPAVAISWATYETVKRML